MSLTERQGHDFVRYRECPLLWKAIEKYGVESIDQVVLVEADMEDDKASEVEQAYIDLWHTNCNKYNNPSFGYNLTDGGDGMSGWKMTEEQYEKRCAVLAESREKRRGVPLSAEHREKLRVSHLGKPGHPTSEETKRKISIANSLANQSPETRRRRSESAKRKMYALNEDTGTRIDFNSVQETAEYFDVSTTTVIRRANGKPGLINGYSVHYVDTTPRKQLSAESRLRRSEMSKKKMYALNEDTGDRIDFDSVQAAADYFGINTMTIYRHRNNGITPIKGYKFYYLTDLNPPTTTERESAHTGDVTV